MSTAPEAPVRIHHTGVITRITLQRPRAINALSLEMIELIREGLAAAAAVGSAVIVLDGDGERGLCGGGDVKAISGGGAEEFFHAEYLLDYLIHASPIPVVALMDGIVMGGGIGISGHATHRVVTETSRLAMPEVRIGIVPDVGGHFLLARAPGRLGEYLAVTAGDFGAADAIRLGFADACVPRAALDTLRERLAAGVDPAEAIRALSIEPERGRLDEVDSWFTPIADAALGGAHAAPRTEPVPAAIRLAEALAASPHPDAQKTAEVVRGGCPTAIAVTLAQLDRTRTEQLNVAQVLTDDFRILTRMAARADFTEGVRAQLIDKDRNPAWQPAHLEALDPATVATLLAPSAPDERVLDLSA